MDIGLPLARVLLADAGAIIRGHFVGTSGKHLSMYVAKDRVTRLPTIASRLCACIAERFKGDDVEVVVAPALGGIALSQWTAYYLTGLERSAEPHRACPEVLSVYAERSCEVEPSHFVLRRDFAKDVQGKRVLCVEDTLLTGGSALGTIRAVVASGGILVGLGAWVNSGNVTCADVGVERMETLLDLYPQIFTEEECADHGLCAQGIPINTVFGHGAEFLARLQK